MRLLVRCVLPLVLAALLGSTLVVPARAATLRVLPLGDSLTYGVGSSTRDGYRKDLWLRLRRIGLPVDFVGSLRNGTMVDNNHEGHLGWRIDQIDAQIAGWMATYKPDVVLLHIGSNDLGQDYDLARAPARLSRLIDRIQAARPGVRVFVAQLVWMRLGGTRWRAYNDAIPGVVASKGPNVHLVPQHIVGARTGDLHDNVHPSNCGYAKMSYVWYNAMGRTRLNTTGRAWPTGYYPFNATTGVCG